MSSQEQIQKEAAKLEESRKKTEIKALGEEVTGMRETHELTFGKPTQEPGSFALDEWTRIEETNPGFKKLRGRIEVVLQNQVREIWNETIAYCKKRGLTVADAQEKIKEIGEETLRNYFDRIDEFTRMTGNLGQAIRLAREQYSRRGSEGPRAAQEVTTTYEAFLYSKFVDAMKRIDPAELLAMIREYQPFITMLAEESKGGIKDVRANIEGKGPMQFDIDTVPVTGPDGKEVRDPDGELLREPIAKLNPNNPNYKKNLFALRDLFLGKPDRKKWRERTDIFFGLRIVAELELQQKQDLVMAFLEPGTLKASEQAADFIYACVTADVMTKQEALQMYGDKTNPAFGLHMDQFINERNLKAPEGGKKYKDFGDFMSEAVASQEKAAREIAKGVENIEKPTVRSFIMNIFQLPKLLQSRFVDWGAITMVLNIGLDISERYSTRGQKHEGRFEAVVKGGVDALKNGKMWAGAAGLAYGLHGLLSVRPGESWIKEKLYGASGKEAEAQKIYEANKKLKDHLKGHSAMAVFFTEGENYKELRRIADGHKERGEGYAISPEDLVMITEERAHNMGYPDANTARAWVIHIFEIFTKDLKDEPLENSLALDDYLKKHVFPEAPPAHLVQTLPPKQKPKT